MGAIARVWVWLFYMYEKLKSLPAPLIFQSVPP